MSKIIKNIFAFFGVTLRFVVSFVLGFLLCALLFVGAGEGKSDWGDCATWVGSCVAFLALIAACYAAILSKRASDAANENAVLLSFQAVIEEKITKIDEEFKKIQEITNDFSEKNPTGKDINRFLFCDTAWKIIESSRKIKEIYYTLDENISFSITSDEFKGKLISSFLRRINPLMVREMMSSAVTVVVFAYKPEDFTYDLEISENYSQIIDALKVHGMYKNWFGIEGHSNKSDKR